MVRTFRGYLTTWLQSKGKVKPSTILNAPQQKGHPVTTVGRDITDYDLDIGYEGSEPKVEQVAQEQREVDPDAQYAKIEMSRNGNLCQRMMPQEVYMGIQWVHKL